MIDTLHSSASETLSDEEVEPAVSTASVDDLFASISDEQLEERRQSWKDLIEDYLLDWLRDPEAIEEEDLTPPSPQAIMSAGIIAQSLAKRNIPPPAGMAPDGEGGIGFEWRADNVSILLEVDQNGSVESIQIDANGRVTRETLV